MKKIYSMPQTAVYKIVTTQMFATSLAKDSTDGVDAGDTKVLGRRGGLFDDDEVE